MQGGQESVMQVDRAGGTGGEGGKNRWARERSGCMDARGPSDEG